MTDIEMLKTNFKRFVVCTFFCAVFPAGVLADDLKRVSGWVEKVAIGNPPIVVDAKIDTGAKHSSLHAVEYHVFSKEGDEWVRFTVKDKTGNDRRLELPLLRYTKIKQKNKQLGQARPVVKLDLCLGNKSKEVEVNLVDRSNFDYPLLVGRSFLQGNFLVDVDRKFLNELNCGTRPGP